MRHFEEALKKIRQLSTQELNMYKRISEQFGRPDITARWRTERDTDTGLPSSAVT
jgi:hypothetical protein